MESFLAFLMVALITAFFVQRYKKKLEGPRGRQAPAGLEVSQQRTAVQNSGSQPGSGKPKPVINTSLCIGCGSCVEVCPETGALELVGGKAILANPEACTGHARCAGVCPTSAITLAFDGVLQTTRVPRVSENFETNVDGLYIVGELGGMGLIKAAINEGKLVMDHLKKRIEAGPPASDGEVDVLIVGSGPAGLSAALSAHEFGLKYLALEAGEIASTIRQYPRHKFLMSEPVAMPLYGKLYIADSSKETLLSEWENIISRTGVRIRTNERVTGVRKNGGNFHVVTPLHEYKARYVVLAMGKRGTPRRLDVPGEDRSKVSYRLIEAETYEGKDILVVGGGDSALEAALALTRDGRNRVTVSYRGSTFQRARERNQARLREAEQQRKLRIVRESRVVEIGESTVRLSTEGTEMEILNDFVFVLIGGESPEEFLKKTGVEIVEKSLASWSFS